MGLPLAIYKAGIMLSHLDIAFSRPESLASLQSSVDEFHDLTAAAQRLETFIFRPSAYSMTELSEPEAYTTQLIESFLHLFINTESF